MLELEPAAKEVIRLLDGIDDDELPGGTPCADTSVAALLDHVVSFTRAFTDGARKTNSGDSAPTPPSADHLDPDWRTVLPTQLDELAAAWRDPSAWEGVTEASGVAMPADMMGAVALNELVLHGWDLARATDQNFTCDPASAQAVLAFTTESAKPENAASREGLFGPVVDVPDDAPDFDRALGFAGRDPAWRPESA